MPDPKLDNLAPPNVKPALVGVVLGAGLVMVSLAALQPNDGPPSRRMRGQLAAAAVRAGLDAAEARGHQGPEGRATPQDAGDDGQPADPAHSRLEPTVASKAP